MVFMSQWSIRPGVGREAVAKFLAGGGQPPAGVKLLGRWHAADLSGGFSLIETDDAKALHEYAGSWMDLVIIHATPVVGDAEAGENMQRLFGG